MDKSLTPRAARLSEEGDTAAGGGERDVGEGRDI